MTIHLNKPYKIIQRKQKRYQEHYHIPADNCVVIPVKEFGEDLSCVVRWEDGEGKIHEESGLFFNNQNIEPLDTMKDYELADLWQYGEPQVGTR